MSEPRSLRLVVDRREGDLVVVEEEGGRVLDLPSWILPPGAREGAVLLVETGGTSDEWRLRIRVDAEATDVARRQAAERLERLRKRDPGGDVEL